MTRGKAFLAGGLVCAALFAAAQDDTDLYGIRAKWANEAELATTNLAPGELVANIDEWSDLRVGDGETPGGVSVGASLLERMRDDPTLLHDIGGASAAEIKALLALSVADQSGAAREALAGVSAVSNRVSSIEADYVATTQAVASVERRVEALETNGTYYCRWSTTDVSQSQVNWIPTNGWPSSSIDLQLYPATSNLFVGIRENWEPTNNLRIAITLTRNGIESGTTSGGIRIGTNTVATFQTTSARRRYELTWVAAVKVWILDNLALNYQNFVFSSSGASRYISLPNDVFLPEVDAVTE